MSPAETMQRRLVDEARNIQARFVCEVAAADPDRIIAELGGSFTQKASYLAGTAHVTVLVGKNRREAYISEVHGRISGGVRIYEPRLRAVE